MFVLQSIGSAPGYDRHETGIIRTSMTSSGNF
jgi:hypothetical protein